MRQQSRVGTDPVPGQSYCAPALSRLYAERQRKFGRPDTGPAPEHRGRQPIQPGRVWQRGLPAYALSPAEPQALEGLCPRLDILLHLCLLYTSPDCAPALSDRAKVGWVQSWPIASNQPSLCRSARERSLGAASRCPSCVKGGKLLYWGQGNPL